VIGRARVCYECCATRDKETMRSTGKATLYLTYNDGARRGYVKNWPGTLCFLGQVSKSRHNISRTRYDVWFMFEGRVWHGVQYGENTQICHCKRTKA
jgi:hypothetical protein